MIFPGFILAPSGRVLFRLPAQEISHRPEMVTEYFLTAGLTGNQAGNYWIILLQPVFAAAVTDVYIILKIQNIFVEILHILDYFAPLNHRKRMRPLFEAFI